MPAQNTQSYEHASHILLSTPYIPFKSKKIPKVFVSIMALHKEFLALCVIRQAIFGCNL